jgi:carboxymethylenebutenolidase
MVRSPDASRATNDDDPRYRADKNGETQVAGAEDIEIPLPDGSVLPAALALPAGGSSTPTPRPGVVVIHEAIGLNDDIRRIAARFAAAGYVTLAPDFLAGLGPMPFCIARFARGIGRVRVGRPYLQLAAAEDWLRRRPDVAGSPIGVAGFCMGGGFALLHAVGADIDVVAPFYAAVPKDGDSWRVSARWSQASVVGMACSVREADRSRLR